MLKTLGTEKKIQIKENTNYRSWNYPRSTVLDSQGLYTDRVEQHGVSHSRPKTRLTRRVGSTVAGWDVGAQQLPRVGSHMVRVEAREYRFRCPDQAQTPGPLLRNTAGQTSK
jgi:hypothetical protein